MFSFETGRSVQIILSMIFLMMNPRESRGIHRGFIKLNTGRISAPSHFRDNDTFPISPRLLFFPFAARKSSGAWFFKVRCIIMILPLSASIEGTRSGIRCILMRKEHKMCICTWLYIRSDRTALHSQLQTLRTKRNRNVCTHRWNRFAQLNRELILEPWTLNPRISYSLYDKCLKC